MGASNNQTQGTQIQTPGTQIQYPVGGKKDGLANLDDFMYDRNNRGKYQSTAINYEQLAKPGYIFTSRAQSQQVSQTPVTGDSMA